MLVTSAHAGPTVSADLALGTSTKSNPGGSAGSIYPTLQMLEDGGFVTSAEVDGKRVYTITDSGRELLSSRTAEAGDDADEEFEARHRLRASAIKLGAAVMGLRGSDDATLDKVRTILDRARKEIYGILATDEA